MRIYEAKWSKGVQFFFFSKAVRVGIMQWPWININYPDKPTLRARLGCCERFGTGFQFRFLWFAVAVDNRR
ncbi:MAG: hypothetical protein HKM93_01155 [Desulfobacteraceae bacterium]|nr:hypothetical protein [Desulfobacteraceae bacterium]